MGMRTSGGHFEFFEFELLRARLRPLARQLISGQCQPSRITNEAPIRTSARELNIAQTTWRICVAGMLRRMLADGLWRMQIQCTFSTAPLSISAAPIGDWLPQYEDTTHQPLPPTPPPYPCSSGAAAHRSRSSSRRVAILSSPTTSLVACQLSRRSTASLSPSSLALRSLSSSRHLPALSSPASSLVAYQLSRRSTASLSPSSSLALQLPCRFNGLPAYQFSCGICCSR